MKLAEAEKIVTDTLSNQASILRKIKSRKKELDEIVTTECCICRKGNKKEEEVKTALDALKNWKNCFECFLDNNEQIVDLENNLLKIDELKAIFTETETGEFENFEFLKSDCNQILLELENYFNGKDGKIPMQLKRARRWFDSAAAKQPATEKPQQITDEEKEIELFAFALNADKIRKLVDGINDTLEIYDNGTTSTKKNKVEVVHFNSHQTKEKLTTIFERLKENGYFDANADLQTWLYICGVADLNGDFRPLNWVKDNGLLAHLVYSLFVNDNNQWATAERCFKVKGNHPKTNTLKGLCCKGFKADNKRHNDLDKLLKV